MNNLTSGPDLETMLMDLVVVAHKRPYSTPSHEYFGETIVAAVRAVHALRCAVTEGKS